MIGAGGGFNRVLLESGVGKAIADVALGSHASPLLLAWIVAALIRVATGSATVAMTTSAGIVAPIALATPGTSAELLVLATGAGSLVLSHVNDSGFWLIKEFFNMTVPQTLKTWTVAETIIGVAGLAFTMLLSSFIGTERQLHLTAEVAEKRQLPQRRQRKSFSKASQLQFLCGSCSSSVASAVKKGSPGIRKLRVAGPRTAELPNDTNGTNLIGIGRESRPLEDLIRVIRAFGSSHSVALAARGRTTASLRSRKTQKSRCPFSARDLAPRYCETEPDCRGPEADGSRSACAAYGGRLR